MIINVWSTPRTGSNWYTKYLRTLHPGSIIVPEIFNCNSMSSYFTLTDTGNSVKHCLDYIDGCFYTDYYLNSAGALSTRNVYNERQRNSLDETAYRISLMHECNPLTVMILHNHIDPLPLGVYDFLSSNAVENHYVHRLDKRAQLASYAIAIATNEFCAFDIADLTFNRVADVPVDEINSLMRRIKLWDLLPKMNIIAYEGIDFADIPGFPKKQNIDYRTRLSDNMLNIIDELVIKYEQEKNMPL